MSEPKRDTSVDKSNRGHKLLAACVPITSRQMWSLSRGGHRRRSLLLSAILTYGVISSCVLAADLTKPVGAVSVGSVEQFLSLVGRCDTNALFDLDWTVQQELAAIRANSPAFQLEKKIQAYTSQKKPSILSGDRNDYARLLMILPLVPKKTIVEISGKEGQVLAYVNFSFESPQKSPLAGEPFESMWSVRPEPVKFLREIVLAIHFSPQGLFQAVSPVPDTTTYWEGLPFRIIAAQVSGSSDFGLKIKTTGDRPVGKATIKIGDHIVEKDDISPNPQNFIIGYGYCRASSDEPYKVQARLNLDDEQIGSTSNVLVIISLNSAGGQKDEVCFTMPMLGGDQLYLRRPWNESAPWKSKVGVINDDVSTQVNASIARRAAENKAYEAENQKLAAIIKESGPFSFWIKDGGNRYEFSCKLTFDSGVSLENGRISGKIIFPKGMVTKIEGMIRKGQMTFQEVETLVEGDDSWKPGDKYVLQSTSEGILAGSRYVRGQDDGPVKLTYSPQ